MVAEAVVGVWFSVRTMPEQLSVRIDAVQHLAVLDRLSIFHDDGDYFAATVGGYLVEYLHRLDDADHRIVIDMRTHLDERVGVWRGGPVESSEHRALDFDQ